MAQTYNLTADGSTAAITLEGFITVAAYGTFGGGTLTLQGSLDSGTTWFSLTDANDAAKTFTADGAANIEVGEMDVRVTLAGATAPDIDITFSSNRITSKL